MNTLRKCTEPYYAGTFGDEKAVCKVGATQDHSRTKAKFHRDNHQSMKTMAKLDELGYGLLPHPLYSPDLAPSDFFLSTNLERMLAGNKLSGAYFQPNDDVIMKKLLDSYNL